MGHRAGRPAIATLAAADGPLQMSLFDNQDLAQIAHPGPPGERLIACRNPALAAERARKRSELLAATDTLLAGIAGRATGGTLAGAGEIGTAVGKVIDKYKMGKHVHTTITDTSFTYRPDQARIDAEAALDGIYVLRTSVDTDTLDPAAVVQSYKNLANVERDFRLHQGRRPRPAAHPPPPRRPRQSPRADLLARLVSGLAPAQSLGATDIHRRAPPPAGQPGRRRTALRRRRRQSRTQTRRQPATQLPRPARSPGHPHPQPDPLPRRQH